MQERHGQSRLGWAVAAAAALLLAVGAILWATGPGDEPGDESRRAPEKAAATPLRAPLPDVSPSLPSPDAALDPVQPLAPPIPPMAPRSKRAASAKTSASASLDLTLLQPCGALADGVKLSVTSATAKWTLNGRSVAVDKFPPRTDMGRISFTELAAGRPVRLRGFDAMEYEVLDVELTLAPDEHRLLTETIGRDLSTVVVRVIDGRGRPVDGASITLVAALTQGSTRSIRKSQADSGFDRPGYRYKGGNGIASFERLAAESVSVSGQHEGYAPAWITDAPLDRDPLELVLTLEPGFPVEVEVVDEAGRVRDVDSVELRGSPIAARAVRTAPGRYRFAAFPGGANGITAIVKGRSWSIDHDARQPRARLVVPSSGSLAASWDDLDPGCVPMGLFIFSEPPGWGWFESMNDATRATRGPVVFDDLAPGDYRLELHCPEARGLDRSARVTVVSGQRTEVVIGP